MKRINKLFLMGAIALSFVACKNEDVPNPDQGKGTTYVTLQMKVNAKPATRAAAIGNYAGTAAEQLVSKIDLYIVDEGAGTVNKKTFNVGTASETEFGKDASGNIYQTLGFKTEPGTKTFYLVVNPTTSMALTTANPAEFEKAYIEAVDNMFAASKANFVMTGKIQQTINPGITQASANTATNTANNLVSIDVNRVVAKTAVVSSTTLNKNLTIGKIGELKFTVANGNKQVYMFKKTAAATAIESTDPNMDGTDATTAWNSTWNAQYWQVGTSGASTEYTTPSVVSAKGADVGAYNGKYFLENNNNAWYWGNTTYAKVYTTFIPAILDGAANVATTAATFYKGDVDGAYYSTAQKAKDAGNTKAYKYDGGKCGYSVLLNADDYNLANVTKSPTTRNNFYILEITQIANVGYNYDPNDPNDPNLPKPGVAPNDANTDEPTEPIGPKPSDPIKAKETWMRVKATVLDWRTVTNEVVLK